MNVCFINYSLLITPFHLLTRENLKFKMAASLVLLVVSLCASAFPVSAGAVRGASPVDEMMKNQEFLYHWLEREYKFRPSHKGRQVPKGSSDARERMNESLGMHFYPPL